MTLRRLISQKSIIATSGLVTSGFGPLICIAVARIKPWYSLLSSASITTEPTKVLVQRHRSEFGKARHLFTRNYLSPTKFQDCTRNRLLFSQQRSESSNLGNLSRGLHNLSEAKEAFYLRELSHDYGPKVMIRVFESRPSMHKNSLALCEYFKALGKVDRPVESELLTSLHRVRQEEDRRLDIGWHSIRLGYYILYFGAIYASILNKVEPILDTNTKFSDVEGVDAEAMAELEEIVYYIRNPEECIHLGDDKLPKGVLLCGPSNTNKTLLAKAIAGEAGVPFFQSDASDSKFDVARVKDLFAAAKKQAPCIIFIDDIKSVGESRDQILKQIVVELDGFKHNEGILVIATANFPELLVEDLVRPGRFDRHVVIDKRRTEVTNFTMSYIGGPKGII